MMVHGCKAMMDAWTSKGPRINTVGLYDIHIQIQNLRSWEIEAKTALVSLQGKDEELEASLDVVDDIIAHLFLFFNFPTLMLIPPT
jgi:hypothetical protein